MLVVRCRSRPPVSAALPAGRRMFRPAAGMFDSFWFNKNYFVCRPGEQGQMLTVRAHQDGSLAS